MSPAQPRRGPAALGTARGQGECTPHRSQVLVEQQTEDDKLARQRQKVDDRSPRAGGASGVTDGFPFGVMGTQLCEETKNHSIVYFRHRQVNYMVWELDLRKGVRY